MRRLAYDQRYMLIALGAGAFATFYLTEWRWPQVLVGEVVAFTALYGFAQAFGRTPTFGEAWQGHVSKSDRERVADERRKRESIVTLLNGFWFFFGLVVAFVCVGLSTSAGPNMIEYVKVHALLALLLAYAEWFDHVSSEKHLLSTGSGVESGRNEAEPEEGFGKE